MTQEPMGELSIRTMAMPADTNPAGDIFGGWVLSQMDMAAGLCASHRAGGRVATVALDGLSFIRPVKVGDILSVYTSVIATGRTSITVLAEAWALREYSPTVEKVTEGKFTLVSIDANGKPAALT